ncbi:unnamed protein product [Miscanthus lutarioriparius]|uniref:Protein kinase domain-containing protein n=1 Tax=Miscanthus lutarioriparius TaxID=422564 RepID=A0A811RCQ3_9POAL|nr:unnamed protein product [Miscanthus lutarioriparius]
MSGLFARALSVAANASNLGRILANVILRLDSRTLPPTLQFLEYVGIIHCQQDLQEEVIINPTSATHLGGPEAVQNQQEHITAMDELTDTDSDVEPPQVALPIPPVEIAPFPDFNNLQPMIPHEIQIEDLLGYDADNLHQLGPEPVDQNIQIGMVQIAQPAVDPIFGNLSPIGHLPPLGPSPEDYRYWSPTFDWAKDFLQSNALSFMRSEMSATKIFRQDCLLGEGGFGRVYERRLENGQAVAVKQLDRNGLQGNREFLAEVLMLSLLHQTNLVNLIVYCADGDQRLLVYEFMPLGSLEDHLHGIVHGGEHFGDDGDWRSISICMVRLPNAAIVAVAKCEQPNKTYGASSYMAYASLEVLCFNA